MTTQPEVFAIAAGVALLALLAVTGALLRGWHEWIALQRLALEGRGRQDAPATPGPAAARIELADLKERVRKLEAIASGVDL